MKFLKKSAGLSIPIILIVLPAVAWINHQAIYDWWQLRDYRPSAPISALATADKMTDRARNIFYVNHPQLVDDIKKFRSSCAFGEQTIILGCYHSNQAGIYIYNVHDMRLGGIQEVTSAHEMLHAAYDRLSKKQRQTIDALLVDFYKHGLVDQRIKDTIADYKKTEPNDVENEMHSVFGTEIAVLPSALENYYKQYFIDRAAIAAFSAKYESEFTSRSAKAHSYENQLGTLKQKIDNEESSLKSFSARIESERLHLDSLRNDNKIDEYNTAVSSFNSQVDDYNFRVGSYKKDVADYNSLLEQYNQVAGELSTLFDSIDTRLGTKPMKESD
ncbi:hypothetical protein HYW35_00600 [Candidatus Saccharibacteria bacterium]|nr:hypothetical protein [Candidatus Saccharibacteria bacterium]